MFPLASAGSWLPLTTKCGGLNHQAGGSAIKLHRLHQCPGVAGTPCARGGVVASFSTSSGCSG